MSTKLQPAHFSLDFAIRPNILALPRYITSTSNETQARPEICLDANENSAGSCLASQKPRLKYGQSSVDLSGLNRYPPASQSTLKQRIVQWRQLESKIFLAASKLNYFLFTLGIGHLCLGSGASDIVDLIIRVTCTPSKDKILITVPTFELYRVCAELHDVGVQECCQELTREGDFRLPLDEVGEPIGSVLYRLATDVTKDLHHAIIGQ